MSQILGPLLRRVHVGFDSTMQDAVATRVYIANPKSRSDPLLSPKASSFTSWDPTDLRSKTTQVRKP